VGLDIKAPLDDAALHARITGVQGGERAVARCLEVLLAGGVPLQLRTTVHPLWLRDAQVERLQLDLARRGAPPAVLQPGSPPAPARV
jgi:pyruvate formate lyase activating enzyme